MNGTTRRTRCRARSARGCRREWSGSTCPHRSQKGRHRLWSKGDLGGRPRGRRARGVFKPCSAGAVGILRREDRSTAQPFSRSPRLSSSPGPLPTAPNRLPASPGNFQRTGRLLINLRQATVAGPTLDSTGLAPPPTRLDVGQLEAILGPCDGGGSGLLLLIAGFEGSGSRLERRVASTCRPFGVGTCLLFRGRYRERG